MGRVRLRDLENHGGGNTSNARKHLEGFHEGKQVDHISILESLESKGHVKSSEISKERLAAACQDTKIWAEIWLINAL